MKKCCHSFFERQKRGIQNIGAFFKTEHTPLENGLLVSTALLGGLVLGLCLSPKKNIQVGSSNGCNNKVTDFPIKKK